MQKKIILLVLFISNLVFAAQKVADYNNPVLVPADSLTLSSSDLGLFGPFSLSTQYSENFGVSLLGKWVQNLGKFDAVALEVDAGGKEYRINGTYGHLFGDKQLFKVTGEYLIQDLNFNFDSGEVNQWVGQTAFGGSYKYLLNKGIFNDLNLNVTYSKAQSKNLDTIIYHRGNDVYANYRRIAGGIDKSASLGTDLLLTKFTLIGLQLNYDNLVYSTEYNVDNQDASGFGVTVNAEQILGDYLKLKLSASNRKPYNDYRAELNWLAWVGRTSKLELGINDEYVNNAGSSVPNDNKIGMSLSYQWDTSINPKTAKYTAIPITALDDLISWTSEPAVRMASVLAIADQKSVLVDDGPKIHFPDGGFEFLFGKLIAQDLSDDFDDSGAPIVSVKASENLNKFGLKIILSKSDRIQDNSTWNHNSKVNAGKKIVLEGTPAKLTTGTNITVTATNLLGESASGSFKLIIDDEQTPIVDLVSKIYQADSTVTNDDITGNTNFGGCDVLTKVEDISPDGSKLSDYGLRINLSDDKKHIYLNGMPTRATSNGSAREFTIRVTNDRGYTDGKLSLTINSGLKPPEILNINDESSFQSGISVNGQVLGTIKTWNDNGVADDRKITLDQQKPQTCFDSANFYVNQDEFGIDQAVVKTVSENSKCQFTVEITNAEKQVTSATFDMNISFSPPPIVTLTKIVGMASSVIPADTFIGTVDWKGQSAGSIPLELDDANACFSSDSKLSLGADNHQIILTGKLSNTPGVCEFKVTATNDQNISSTNDDVVQIDPILSPTITQSSELFVEVYDKLPWTKIGDVDWHGGTPAENGKALTLTTNGKKCFATDAFGNPMASLKLSPDKKEIYLTGTIGFPKLGDCGFDVTATNSAKGSSTERFWIFIDAERGPTVNRS